MINKYNLKLLVQQEKSLERKEINIYNNRNILRTRSINETRKYSYTSFYTRV